MSSFITGQSSSEAETAFRGRQTYRTLGSHGDRAHSAKGLRKAVVGGRQDRVNLIALIVHRKIGQVGLTVTLKRIDNISENTLK